MRNKPNIVVVACLLCVVIYLLTILTGIFPRFNKTTMEGTFSYVISDTFSLGNLPEPFYLKNEGMFHSIFLVIVGIAELFGVYGVWNYKKWSTLVFIGILVTGFASVAAMNSENILNLVYTPIIMISSLIIIFNNPDVKDRDEKSAKDIDLTQ